MHKAVVVADGDGNGGGGGKRLKYGSMAYIANWGCDAKTTTLHTHSGARTQKSAYKNTLKSTQKHTKRIILTQNCVCANVRAQFVVLSILAFG